MTENLLSTYWIADKQRGTVGEGKIYLHNLRRLQFTKNRILRLLYKATNRFFVTFYGLEISYKAKIGKGFYIGHPHCITVNPSVEIGEYCNIHRGVLIGQENRGKRKGTPKIGNYVWMGVNSTIVGNIKIGDDVLIAPNSYVNRDVPSHSVVFGNPCIIKYKAKATEGYICNNGN